MEAIAGSAGGDCRTGDLGRWSYTGSIWGVRDPSRLIGSSHEGDPQRRLLRITNSPKYGYHLWQ